ncbi:uncharacterized protein LOC126705069 [Quercus robur]|uniref:uncharacterized protein LOC126705069 n=1 Tax=Quercus robur TaxID=38942 RepID=UPI002162B20C|nr:uncharacterized protein LOC126705069 [Quercus robur]
MSCLAWNCRGLGNLCTVRELGEIVRTKDPSLVFLAETLTDEARLEFVQGEESEWRLTGFYGEPETANRIEAWNKLRCLNSYPICPWLCLGDFNEIVRQDEKVGGALRSHNQMQLFRDVLDECGFMDLGFVGPKFTWARHYEDGSSIWERLDRGLATNNWFLKFPGSRVHHLHCDSSDHQPILVVFSGLEHPRRKKPFRFEEMWLSNTSCEEVVKAAWYCTSGAEDGREVLNKVEKCGKDLNWWNRNVFGNVRRELEKAKKMLIKAEREAILSGNNFQVRHLKAEIEVLLDKEAIMWQQRSRLLWAREGDRNTKYFHSCATRRHRKNLIESIRDDEGVWRVQ